MKLKSVIFYQAVKLWDNVMYATVQQGKNGRMDGIEIDLVDHIVTVSKPGESELVIVGTANMRSGRAESGYVAPVIQEVPPIEQEIARVQSMDNVSEAVHPDEFSPKKYSAKKRFKSIE